MCLRFDLASDHSCCKPNTTIILATTPTNVVNRMRQSNLLFTLVDRCVDEQEAGNFCSQILVIVLALVIMFLCQ